MKSTRLLTVLFCINGLISCNLSNTKNDYNGTDKTRELSVLWSYSYTGEASGLSLSSLRPGIVNKHYVIIAPDKQYSCISVEDGTLLWQYENPNKKEANNIQILTDGTDLFGKEDNGDYYFSVDISSGKENWKYENQQGLFYDFLSDAIDQNYIYLAAKDSAIYVYDKNGNYQKAINLHSYPRYVNVVGNQLYVGEGWKPSSKDNSEGQIEALDKLTGEEKWSYHTAKGGFYYANLINKDGIIYSGTTEGPGEFVALDAATGQVKWKLEGYWCYRFTLGDGKIFINDGNYILAVDRQTGKVLWKDYFQGHTESNLAYVDGYLYHAHNGGLFVWDAQTGKRVAGPIRAPDGSDWNNISAANGRVFIQSDFHLYCYKEYGQ